VHRKAVVHTTHFNFKVGQFVLAYLQRVKATREDNFSATHTEQRMQDILW
jgi:hypothetical protein